MASCCIRNAQYLGKAVDLFVEDGLIQELTAHAKDRTLPSEVTVFDANGLRLFPSFIDVHTHLRDPGFTWKETVESGLEAALHGGFGAILCMANTDPVNDNAAVTQLICNKGRNAFPHGPTVYPIGAATMGLQGTALSPALELRDAGCVALSNDGLPLKSTEMLRRVMEYAADADLLLIDHCEDPWLAAKSHMNEGETSGRLGLKGQPDVAETMQVMRDVLMAEYLNLPIHLAHISCKRSLDAIAWAKARGVQVTAETCPHYLFLDETATEGYNTLAKVNPPLRTPDDIEAMRKAIKDGTIDMFATDHAPHATHEKETAFDHAPNGFTGLDLAVSLTYELVRQNVISESDFIRLWSEAPAKRFKLPHNRFQKDDPANFFLFDSETTWKVTPENLYSKSHNTPWLGQNLRGRVHAHWLNGIRLF